MVANVFTVNDVVKISTNLLENTAQLDVYGLFTHGFHVHLGVRVAGCIRCSYLEMQEHDC